MKPRIGLHLCERGGQGQIFGEDDPLVVVASSPEVVAIAALEVAEPGEGEFEKRRICVGARAGVTHDKTEVGAVPIGREAADVVELAGRRWWQHKGRTVKRREESLSCSDAGRFLPFCELTFWGNIRFNPDVVATHVTGKIGTSG